jgi:hypothetical protein
MVQAEDRVHRIGQRNACNIHYLLAPDSCDSLMWPSLVRKLRIVSQICDGTLQAKHSLKAWTPDASLPEYQSLSGTLSVPDVTMLGREESLCGGQTDLSSCVFAFSKRGGGRGAGVQGLAGMEGFGADKGGEVDGEDGMRGVLQQRSSLHRVHQEGSLAGGVVGGGEGGVKDQGRGALEDGGGGEGRGGEGGEGGGGLAK